MSFSYTTRSIFGEGIAEQKNYASYLLRFRLLHSQEQDVWVATIHSTATGEQRSFASVGELAQFLQTEFDGDIPTPAAAFLTQDTQEFTGKRPPTRQG